MTERFSVARLERIGDHIEGYVDDGRMPCAMVLVNDRGREAYYHACGLRDVESGAALTRDTVFRIYSMTKPITSVALMMLYEQGCFQLDDPVHKYIPQWKQLQVYESGEGEAIKTREPQTVLTIKNLLTHTSGLTYGATNHCCSTRGTRWNYSVSTDVCGYLVQLFSDRDLDVFVREEITQPLGMDDSGFQVPEHAADRFAACYQHHADGFPFARRPGRVALSRSTQLLLWRRWHGLHD